MILIMSQLSDFATTQVIDWLVYYKKEFLRLNGDEVYEIDEITTDKINISKNGCKYDLLQCDSYWYRRDGIGRKHLHVPFACHFSSDKLTQNLQKALDEEYSVIKCHIYHKIENTIGNSRCLGNYDRRSLNKMDVLELASACGFAVPQTMITCSLDSLKLLLTNSACITKAASESIYVSDNKYFYVSYTTRLILNKVLAYPSNFMASLFQMEVKKKFELRVFYLNKRVFASVIFSQQNVSSEVDCRRARQYRYLPYRLPKVVVSRLCKLMKKLHLKTGSVDLIVDCDNNYIFLEVNPVGQFVAYGEFCNYYLDKELAKCL